MLDIVESQSKDIQGLFRALSEMDSLVKRIEAAIAPPEPLPAPSPMRFALKAHGG